jgi:transcriptional regulator with XRE-family HTH domain
MKKANSISKSRRPGRPSLRTAALAKNIRAARLALRMSQRTLAEAIGIDGVTVSRYEVGALAPSATRLRELARVLMTTTEQLLGDAASDLTAVAARNDHAMTRNDHEMTRSDASPLDRIPALNVWWTAQQARLAAQGYSRQELRELERVLVTMDAARTSGQRGALDRRSKNQILREWSTYLRILTERNGRSKDAVA